MYFQYSPNFILIKVIIILEMWKVFVKLQPISVIKMERMKRFWQYKSFKFSIGSIALFSALYYIHPKTYFNHSSQQIIEVEPLTSIHGNRLMEIIKYMCRVVELSLIFAPTIITLPLYLFNATRQYWINILLNAIQRAGIVWIKAFQHLSHRRDIIGQEMAEKFSILRQNSPLHTQQQTQEIIHRVYGKTLNDMFQQFDSTPIASGSVSQVYKAKFKGKIVAVKVRHPGAGNNLQKDIQLLFSFSKFLSYFSRYFEIPITELSLKRILREQLCFLQQKRNIDNFNMLIIDKNVKFPITYPESTNQVLIEQYIDGRTIGFYENHDHNLNKVIANIGAKAFFSMLLKYNFVHADCHAGNILVRIKSVPNELTSYIIACVSQTKNFIISQVIKYGYKSQFLKRLSEENYEYEKGVQELIDVYKERVQIILIDVGMAIHLTKQKKASFQQFLEEIIQGNPVECARWIYRISKFNGIQLVEGQNNAYLSALEEMFTRVHKTALSSLEGIVVLRQMLGVIREHNMKIDGQISILLTNMLILESIAKDLDPNINILRCAVPYLQYK